MYFYFVSYAAHTDDNVGPVLFSNCFVEKETKIRSNLDILDIEKKLEVQLNMFLVSVINFVLMEK